MARAVTDLMRGSVSAVAALFELIPLLQQPLAICRYPRQCLAAMARRDCSGKYLGIGDADLGLKVGSDDVNMRRIMVRGIQGDLVCAEILDRWHGVAAAEHKYTAKYAEFQVNRRFYAERGRVIP